MSDDAPAKQGGGLGGLVFIGGMVLLIHGVESNDAWYDGETITGAVIVGVAGAGLAIRCCCCCLAGGGMLCFGANGRDAEPVNTADKNKAVEFLERAKNKGTTDFFEDVEKGNLSTVKEQEKQKTWSSMLGFS